MSRSSIRFIIPLRPPSVNSLYNVMRYGPRLEVKLKPEVVIFKATVKQYVPTFTRPSEHDLVYFNMTFHDSAYFFKNGKLRKFDITNTEKALLDAICERLGFDDCYVKERRLKHVNSADGRDKMEVEIGVIRNDP